MDARISASAAAFDAIASRYDDMFSGAANPLIAMMRARVFRAVDRHFSAPGQLLEIGCGTGEDALSLVERGHRVVACDPAPAMIATARAKLAAAGRADAVEFLLGPVEDIAAPGRRAGGPSTACSPTSRRSTARCRWRRCGCCSSGRCAGAGASWRSSSPASARWRWPCSWRGPSRGARCAAFAAPPSPTSRDSASRCGTTAPPTSTARSGAGFRRIETRSLGLFLPPLGFGHAFARVPGLLPALAAIEDRTAGLPGLRRMGDHVLLVYERS